MPILSDARTYHKKFLFQVEFEGLESADFVNVTGLRAQVAVVEQWEGGRTTPHKSPGRTTFPNITLQRGRRSNGLGIYRWFQQVTDASNGRGVAAPDPQFRRNGAIVQRDLDGSILAEWKLIGAWPAEYMPGEWDNTTDENVMEEIVIVIDRFELKTGSK
jgi:phage tail-like protein